MNLISFKIDAQHPYGVVISLPGLLSLLPGREVEEHIPNRRNFPGSEFRIPVFLGRLSLFLNFFFHHFFSLAPPANGFAEK